MTDPDPIAEARRLLAGVEARFGTLDYRADEQDGAGLYSVVMVESEPRAYALCYATTEESAALIAAAPRLLQALLDRLEAAEREFRQSHANNCTPDYTERGLHSSYCLLYMVGPE